MKIDCPYCKEGKVAVYWPYHDYDFKKEDSFGALDPMKWVECDHCKGTKKIKVRRKLIWEEVR